MNEALETKHHMDHVTHEHGHGNHGKNNLNRNVAIISSILALTAAFTALQTEAAHSHALVAKNEAILEQAKASDQWAYFQAKSIKLELKTISSMVSSNKAVSEENQKKIDEYTREKNEIQAVARKAEERRDYHNKVSTHFLHVHHRFASALTLIQVGIVLSTICLVVQRRSVLYLGVGIGLVGIGYMVGGFLLQYGSVH
jgi:lipopolysaccharide export LptBFGC system permease protein LptF